MGYALKIKNVNFSTVAVGRVTYINPVLCTGISLSANTATFDTYLATQTITATLTPSDTTEQLTWSTSDSQIATVNEGVITIHGIGTATITATCGNATATVSVSASSLKITAIYYEAGKYPEASSIGERARWSTNAAVESVVMTYDSSLPSNLHFSNSTDAQPIIVPYGAVTAKVVTSDNSSVYGYITYFDTVNTVTYNGAQYPAHINRYDKTITNAQTVSYGQVIGYYAASSTDLDKASYILFNGAS